MPEQRPRAVIVGAGIAGISAAIALARAGVRDIVILERADALGGTWRDNRYPGVACDVPSHLYALASHPSPDWSRAFAPGREIRDYLKRVVDAEGLRGRIRFGHDLADARWDGDGWSVTARHATGTTTIRTPHLVLACGRLTEPRIPLIPGLGDFAGEVLPSARWRDDLELEGRRIAVVGTGASAIQLVPALVERGARVTLFQRSAAWIVPRGDREHTAAERAAWRKSRTVRSTRRAPSCTPTGRPASPPRSGDAAAAEAAAPRSRTCTHRSPTPSLRAALTPDYAFGCKRVLLSDDFYPAIASGAVTLEPSALAAVDRGDSSPLAAPGTAPTRSCSRPASRPRGSRTRRASRASTGRRSTSTGRTASRPWPPPAIRN